MGKMRLGISMCNTHNYIRFLWREPSRLLHLGDHINKKVVLASPPKTQLIVHPETYSLRLSRLQPYVYDLTTYAELERRKSTTYRNLTLLNILILPFKVVVKFFC